MLNKYISRNLIFTLTFFILIFLIIFFRETCWLVEGSFKSSEFEYYRAGKSKSFLENLFFIYPGTGALMLWSNITNSTMSLFSYDKAKILSNYFTVFVYLFICIYIYSAKSSLLTLKKYKIFAIFLVLLSPPKTPEVWMSSAHLRGYFGILSFFYYFMTLKVKKEIQIS